MFLTLSHLHENECIHYLFSNLLYVNKIQGFFFIFLKMGRNYEYWLRFSHIYLSAPPMRHFDGTKKGQSAEYRRALRKACISNAFQYSTTSSLVRYRADLDMKRVISDTDGGHLTNRPQGRRNRRGRRSIAASPDF